jgi:6-pyruvoyltetrahydropterin/6-carboxytetrahydropterin synthase
MYEVEKTFEIAGAHSLNLPYESPCNGLHGHNWIVTVKCRAEELNEHGMVVDFTFIKKAIHGRLDHKNINEVLPHLHTTAENLARWICDEIPEAYEVVVEETPSSKARYVRPA